MLYEVITKCKTVKRKNPIIIYNGLINRAKKNKTIAVIPEIKYQLGKPSLYKTKIKDKNIIALPASGCIRISKTGRPMIPKAISWCFVRFKFI